MKIIVTADRGIMLSSPHIPETITAYTEDQIAYLKESAGFDKIAKVFTQQWRHKDVLSMMTELKSADAFEITSTLSSKVMFKKRE